MSPGFFIGGSLVQGARHSRLEPTLYPNWRRRESSSTESRAGSETLCWGPRGSAGSTARAGWERSCLRRSHASYVEQQAALRAPPQSSTLPANGALTGATGIVLEVKRHRE